MTQTLSTYTASVTDDAPTDYTWLRYFDPARGLSNGGIRNIIARRTAAALGEQFALAAHDTRRTAAALAHEAGMALPDIQALLRHKDGDVTLRYIGVKPNYDSRTLGRYLWFG